MSKTNQGVFVIGDIYSRFLSPESAEALRAFAESGGPGGVNMDTIRTLANITGRGYRPPTDVRGWQTVYEILERINKEDEESEE